MAAKETLDFQHSILATAIHDLPLPNSLGWLVWGNGFMSNETDCATFDSLNLNQAPPGIPQNGATIS